MLCLKMRTFLKMLRKSKKQKRLDDFAPGSDSWKADEATTDYRRIWGGNYFSNSKFNISNKLTVSLTDYFLYFLPVDFIKDVIIPNMNSHARNISYNRVDLIFLGYLTCFALLMIMTVCRHVNKRVY
jgi:hypothetical protein